MILSEKIIIALRDFEEKYNEIAENRDMPKRYCEIYNSAPIEFKNIFAYWHFELNTLIDFMNYKRRNDKEEFAKLHYNADQSRRLISLLDQINEIAKLTIPSISINIHDSYKKLIEEIKPQLVPYGGSHVQNYKIFELMNYEPVFTIKHSHHYGGVMNIIFAANGPKPDIIISDAIENKIEIVGNKEYCLVYDLEIQNNNLTWEDLNKWWIRDNKTLLSKRLLEIYSEDAIEKRFLNEYLIFCSKKDILKYPALVPEVYIHYDPKTIKELDVIGKEKRLVHQRMDFLMLINGHRIVIELDGKQHYSEDDKPSPKKYADLVEYDRKMKLLGYDVYRFGGFEFTLKDFSKMIHGFFDMLILKYAPHLLDK